MTRIVARIGSRRRIICFSLALKDLGNKLGIEVIPAVIDTVESSPRGSIALTDIQGHESFPKPSRVFENRKILGYRNSIS
jgi:hypothetical protein